MVESHDVIPLAARTSQPADTVCDRMQPPGCDGNRPWRHERQPDPPGNEALQRPREGQARRPRGLVPGGGAWMQAGNDWHPGPHPGFATSQSVSHPRAVGP